MEEELLAACREESRGHGGVGVQKLHFKRGSEEKLGSGKLVWVSDSLCANLGSSRSCLQLPNLPPGAAETLSLQRALGSNPSVRRESGEDQAQTFLA